MGVVETVVVLAVLAVLGGVIYSFIRNKKTRPPNSAPGNFLGG